MRKVGIEWVVVVVACFGLVSLGCSPASTNAPPMAADDLEHAHDEHGHDEHGHDEHGDHVHASTYAEAMTQIETLRNEIKAAFTKGDGQSADGAVHLIGHALEDLTALAKQAGLSAEDQVTVGIAVESLLDAFGKIDEKLHGGAGAVYSDVETDINAAFETLKKFGGQQK